VKTVHTMKPTTRRDSFALFAPGLARFAPLALGLVVAVMLGVLVIKAINLPKAWAGLVCLSLGGGCGALVWLLLKLPVVPILRVAWLASFWFRLEINLFPIAKAGHETLVGLVVSLNLLLSVMLLGAFLWARWQGKETGLIWPPAFTWTAAVLVLLSVLSVINGAETGLGLYALWGLLTELLICYVAATQFRTLTTLRQVVICLAVTILLNSALGILQYFELFGGWELLGATTGDRQMKLPGMDVSRASGLVESANSFGWALVSFCPVIITPVLLAKTSLRGWAQRLCVVAFFFGIVALLLTFSRGSWMAFALTAPLLAGLVISALPRRERWRMIFRLAGVLVFLLLLSLPFLEPFSARLLGEDDGAAESRFSLMEVALEMIQSNPWLGVGLSSYEAVMRRYDRTADFITEHFPYPVHNMFMHVAAEAGIPALLCLLLLALIALHCGWKVWQRKDALNLMPRAVAVGLALGLLAYLITGMKEPSSFDSGQIRNLFLLFGLLIATERASHISQPPINEASGGHKNEG
jgi:putative inorganic carbon (hco3(-)) transporter